MEGFKRGFYTTSKKLKRKPESNLGQSSFLQPQPFSQSQKLEKEHKLAQKTTHEITPTSEENPRKQIKSALHQQVSDLNPSCQMSMGKLIKVVLNVQKEVRKLRKDNEKLMEQLNLAEGIQSRLMSKERALRTF